MNSDSIVKNWRTASTYMTKPKSKPVNMEIDSVSAFRTRSALKDLMGIGEKELADYVNRYYIIFNSNDSANENAVKMSNLFTDVASNGDYFYRLFLTEITNPRININNYIVDTRF
jgi:hypothetical protein